MSQQTKDARTNVRGVKTDKNENKKHLIEDQHVQTPPTLSLTPTLCKISDRRRHIASLQVSTSVTKVCFTGRKQRYPPFAHRKGMQGLSTADERSYARRGGDGDSCMELLLEFPDDPAQEEALASTTHAREEDIAALLHAQFENTLLRAIQRILVLWVGAPSADHADIP